MRTTMRVLGMTAVASLALAGCGGKSSHPAAAGSSSGTTDTAAANYVTGGTLTEAVGADPGSLDPQQSLLQSTVALDSLTYDYLGRIDAKGALVPSIATAWTTAPTTVTFTIRAGVTCADGTALSPAVIARNFSYVQDPKNKSPWLGVLVPAGSTTTSTATTVTIKAATPYAYLTEGAVQMPLICTAGLDDRKKLAHGTEGSGPFVLSEAVADDHYTLTVRKGYAWGPNGATTAVPGFPAKVILKVVKNETTQANLLLAGTVQLVSLGGADRSRLDKNTKLERIDALGSMVTLNLNEATGHPGSDPAVRTALLKAVDVTTVGAVTLDRRGAKPLGLTIPPSPCLDASVLSASPQLDLAGAKAALDADGWKAGADGVRTKAGKKLALTLIYPPSIGGDSVAAGMELLSEEWKAVGAAVTIKGETDTAYSQVLFGSGNWDAAVLALAATNPAIVASFYSGPAAPNGQNFGSVKNTQYDTLSAKAVSTPGAAGCTDWTSAEKALFSAGDVLPVAALTTSIYGNKAQFAINYSVGIEPMSLRVTK